jgi:hypothetical protein
MPQKILTLLFGLSLTSLLPACARPVEPASTSDADKQQAADQAQGAPAPADAPIAGMASPAPTPTKADGESCLSADECASGTCEGLGCDDAHPGTCQPTNRKCTYDLQPYCGCDGVSFDAGGNCPSRRYAAAGKCPT